MAADRDRILELGLAALLGLVLVVLASTLQPDYVTDHETYERIGREFVVPDCSSLHCTRVLVAWVIEHLPGPSLVKWKTYAVLGNLLAAFGIARLCRRLGLPRDAVRVAVGMSALGAGAQLTLLDPHSSDPFIYALVPWIVLWLYDGRVWPAAIVAAVAVWAKEFAAVPLWVVAAYGVIAGRPALAARSAAAAALVTTMWVAMQAWFILAHNYTYGDNPSANLLDGGYIVKWVNELGPARAAASLLLHFGPLLFLAVRGWWHSDRPIHLLSLAALPALAIFCYVQQPDRAIWNFQFAIVPLAARLFAGARVWESAAWLVAYAITNLPVEGDWRLPIVGTAFVVCAAVSIRIAVTRPAPPWILDLFATSTAPLLSARRVAAIVVTFLILGGALALAADITLHRRHDADGGFNVWGYRGRVVAHDSLRVAVLGGRRILGEPQPPGLVSQLETLLNNERLRGDAGYVERRRIDTVNLGEPADAILTFQQTLDDYAYLRPAVVCFYVGDEMAPAGNATLRSGWRRRSFLFRTTGYLPAIPMLWNGQPESVPVVPAAIDDAGWRERVDALEAAVAQARQGSLVLVATHPFLADGEAARFGALRARLTARFGGDPGFEYLDLHDIVDLSSPRIAEDLSQAVFRLLVARQ